MPLTQWVRVRSPVWSISWLRFLVNCKANILKFGPTSSPDIIWPSSETIFIRRVTTRPVFGGIVLEFNSLSRIPGKGRLDSLLSRPKLTLNFNRTSVWSLFSCYIDFKNILSKFQIYVSYYLGLCFHIRY